MKNQTQNTHGEAAVTLVNLTPHEVVIETTSQTIVLPPTGTVTRIGDRTCPDGFLATSHGSLVEVIWSRQGDVLDLPVAEPDVVYVVSRLVAERCIERSDLMYPAGTRRSDQGHIISCRYLGRPDHRPEHAETSAN